MNLPRRAFLHAILTAAVLPAVPRVAPAQAYPGRGVRIVVGYAAGGPTDIAARLIGEAIIDYYEASGVDLGHYARELGLKPYAYAGHIVPHERGAVQSPKKYVGSSNVLILSPQLDFFRRQP
jgi:hypothetical protein